MHQFIFSLTLSMSIQLITRAEVLFRAQQVFCVFCVPPSSLFQIQLYFARSFLIFSCISITSFYNNGIFIGFICIFVIVFSLSRPSRARIQPSTFSLSSFFLSWRLPVKQTNKRTKGQTVRAPPPSLSLSLSQSLAENLWQKMTIFSKNS